MEENAQGDPVTPMNNEDVTSDVGSPYITPKKAKRTPEEEAFIALNEPNYGSTGFFSHLFLLIWKNFVLLKRRWVWNVAILISPLFVCLLTIYFQNQMDLFTQKVVVDYPLDPISHSLPKCYAPHDCLTLGSYIFVLNLSGLP